MSRSASPPRIFVVAEAGVNHNGRLDLALRLVDAAAEAGADAVKFQTFRAAALAAAQAPLAPYQAASGVKTSQLEMIRGLELGEAEHRSLLERCLKRGIEFMSTPFDEASADLLDSLGVRRFKLSSGEITNRALIEHVAGKGKPLILSTGMSTLDEVEQAVGWARSVTEAPLTLLHCVTEYPAPANEVNLRAMDTLRDRFEVPIGLSDHTEGIVVSVAAAARGAAVIEKHITLDRGLPGPDQRSSLEPSEFRALVEAVRTVSSALGDGVKRVARCEEKNRVVARRSLVAARDLPSGHILRREDLVAKRPATGIAPWEIERVVGRSLRRAMGRDETLTWDSL